MTAIKQMHSIDNDSNGEKSQEKHIEAVKYKTKMCRNWVTKGACPYNEKCMFAHGDHELRSVSLNTNQGLTTEEDIRRFRRSGHGTGPQEAGRATPPAHHHDEYPQQQQQRPPSPQQQQTQRGGQYHHNPYAVPQSYYGPARGAYSSYGAPQGGCQCPDCVGPRYTYYAPPPPPPQAMPCPCEECMRAAHYASYGYGNEGYAYQEHDGYAPEYPVEEEPALPPSPECVVAP